MIATASSVTEAVCEISNCRNRAAAQEPFCSIHRGKARVDLVHAAEIKRLRGALKQAASDMHLISLHGTLYEMWAEAKAGRDRALASIGGAS